MEDQNFETVLLSLIICSLAFLHAHIFETNTGKLDTVGHVATRGPSDVVGYLRKHLRKF